MTARAMMWAVLCRRTSRASGSRSVRIWNEASGGSGGSSRLRSTTSPLTLAATAACARRLPIDSATSRGRVPGATWRAEPSGSFRVIMGGIGSGSPAGVHAPTTGVPRAGHFELDEGSCYGGPGELAFPHRDSFAISPLLQLPPDPPAADLAFAGGPTYA